MILRRATIEDASLLLTWRNDPLTRAMSICGDEVQLAEHLAWLRKSLADPNRLLLIAEADGEPVGTVRLDLAGETEISWTVAPDHRGKGIGQAMVREASPDMATAWIKRENVASQRIAAGAGFVLAADGELQRWERRDRQRIYASASAARISGPLCPAFRTALRA